MLLVTVLAAEEIAMSYVSCDGEVVIGNRTVRYCFKALTSYQRVGVAADFGDVESAAVFL